MTELKKKGLVGSSSDLANILNKVSTTTAAITTTAGASVPSASQVAVATTPAYAQLTLTAHSGVAGVPNMSLPPPRFAHGYHIFRLHLDDCIVNLKSVIYLCIHQEIFTI